jgi:hypothetical protein
MKYLHHVAWILFAPLALFAWVMWQLSKLNQPKL